MSDWLGYVLDDFRFDFAAGSRVLDVGCGEGAQLEGLARQGNWACGLDPSTEPLQNCRARNMRVVQGKAERLPFAAGSFDGVVCKVVLPYTNERMTVSEIGRVLRANGTAYLVSHGAGYYLRYLLRPPRPIYHLYGLRAVMNSWLWAATGLRLPGFLGDTLYQSRKRLWKYYRTAGLELEREWPSPAYLGFPVFLYDRVRKTGIV